jgi:hypothetical protein
MRDADRTQLAGEFGARDRIGDATGVHELARRPEQLDTLEEERPLLREEQGEALVHRHLARVRLHLAEVRIDGGVQRQVRETEARVQAGIRLGIAALESAGRTRTLGAGGEERLRLDHHASPQLTQSGQGAGLRQEAGRRAPHVGPRVEVAGALHLALHLEPPLLLLASGVPQGLERDAHLHHPAVAGQPALGLPQEVRVPVGRPAHHPARRLRTLRADAVLLHAERVHREEIGAPPIQEGVEIENDVVVIVDRVPVGARGTHRFRP